MQKNTILCAEHQQQQIDRGLRMSSRRLSWALHDVSFMPQFGIFNFKLFFTCFRVFVLLFANALVLSVAPLVRTHLKILEEDCVSSPIHL